MTSPLPAGAGMLAAHSRLAQPDKCPPEQYEKWYFEDHIPDVLSTSSIKRALFFINTDPKADRPYLALYPLADLQFLQSDEFIRNIRVTSPLLPRGADGKEGLCYDYMDVDVAYLQHVQTYEPKRHETVANGQPGEAPPIGRSRCLAPFHDDCGLTMVKILSNASYVPRLSPAQTPPTKSLTGGTARRYQNRPVVRLAAALADSLYKHNEAVSRTPGYVRTTRYKVAFSRSNLTSRVLKGFGTEEEEAQAQKQPEMPTWLTCHEFDTTDIDWSILGQAGETKWSKQIVGDAKTMDVSIWSLKRAWGE